MEVKSGRMFEKEILPFMEERIMKKLRTYNVYSINEYEDIQKAAGFKEDVSSFYELVYKGGSGPEYEIDESYDAQNYNTDVYSISAPTQSIAQKWLRETKNLHVLSTPKVVESYNKIGEVVKTEVEFYYWDIYIVGSNKHKHIIQNCFTNQFNTYEEALETGIRESLKLI